MAVFVLEQLGCKIPKKRQLFYVLRDLGRLKVSVKRMREGSSTIGSRYVKDESRIRAMRLMDKLVTLAYHNGSLYLPLAIMKGFRWIERYGLSEYAPASLALVGLLLMSQKVRGLASNSPFCVYVRADSQLLTFAALLSPIRISTEGGRVPSWP